MTMAYSWDQERIKDGKPVGFSGMETVGCLTTTAKIHEIGVPSQINPSIMSLADSQVITAVRNNRNGCVNIRAKDERDVRCQIERVSPTVETNSARQDPRKTNVPIDTVTKEHEILADKCQLGADFTNQPERTHQVTRHPAVGYRGPQAVGCVVAPVAGGDNTLDISYPLEIPVKAGGRVLRETDDALKVVKADVVKLIEKNNPAADTNDVNYVFLRFVLDYLPHGLIGLLIAVIFSASMGSIASAYNSLASTTVVDVYKRLVRAEADDAHYLRASRWATVGWGVFCIVVAQFANRLGSMIEAVNILGSLFYGVILGVFVVAFYAKSIGGRATFWATLIAEVFVIISWYLDLTAFLWLNVIGCLLVVGIAWLLQMGIGRNERTASA